MKKIIILIFLITLSCSNNKVVRNHGQYALDIKINKVEINKSNKNDIVEIFGKPSTISLFDDNIWYYIQREKVNQSLFKLGKSKIKKNIVLEINFNDYGIVDNKLVYLIDDMNDIKISEEKTTNQYQSKSYFGKLLNSMKQKIDSPKLNRKRK
tara:strand:- start:395 stop:853 length:459 start_codon:yes stop_codon:yes gene_type:complete